MRFSERYDDAAGRWPVGTASVLVETSWGRTHVLAAGPDDGATALLLHGDGATATVWAGVAAGLAGRFRVLAPDLPGNPGRSTSSRPFTSTAEMVAWLDELVRATATGPVHLVGHSAGAHLALSYALDEGDRPASVTLLDPTLCFTGLSVRYVLRALPMLLRPTPSRVRRFLAWETRGRTLDPAWLDTFVLGATEFSRTPIVRTRRPSPDRLAGLTVPLRVVTAGRGRAHDAARLARNARRMVRHAVVVEVPAATHHTMPLLDATDLAAAIAATGR